MQFFKALLFGSAALVSLVAAQDEPLALTVVPESVEAGQPVTIEYSGDPNVPTTLTLRKGDPNDLDTVETITTSGTGGTITWTPSESLESGEDYALEISQGEDQVNYSGQIVVTGGTGAPTEDDDTSTTQSVATVTESATASPTESATETASESTTVTVTETAESTRSVVATTVRSNTTMTTSTSTSTNTRETSSRTSGSATGTRTAAATETGSAAQLSGNFAFALGAFAAVAYFF